MHSLTKSDDPAAGTRKRGEFFVSLFFILAGGAWFGLLAWMVGELSPM